jgi:hypothetical protein
MSKMTFTMQSILQQHQHDLEERMQQRQLDFMQQQQQQQQDFMKTISDQLLQQNTTTPVTIAAPSPVTTASTVTAGLHSITMVVNEQLTTTTATNTTTTITTMAPIVTTPTVITSPQSTSSVDGQTEQCIEMIVRQMNKQYNFDLFKYECHATTSEIIENDNCKCHSKRKRNRCGRRHYSQWKRNTNFSRGGSSLVNKNTYPEKTEQGSWNKISDLSLGSKECVYVSINSSGERSRQRHISMYKPYDGGGKYAAENPV